MRIPVKSRWWWLLAVVSLVVALACIPYGGHPFAGLDPEELHRMLKIDLPIGTGSGAVRSYLRDHNLEPTEESGIGVIAVARGAGSLIYPVVRSYKLSFEFSDERLADIGIEEWLTGP